MTRFAPVAPPPLTPPPINLVTSSRNPLADGPQVDAVSGENVRWEEGFAFQPLPNVSPTTRGFCDPTHVDADESTSEPAVVQTTPWLIEAEDHCSTFGYKGRDFIGRAVAALIAATPKGVEREFWTGAIATADGSPNLFLTNGNATDVTPSAGTAVTIEEGIERLEAALAGCGAGSRGMIHVPAIATPPLTVARRDAGMLLLTPRDTIVVPGSGYTGTDPDGGAPAADTTWLYATGMVEVRLGDIVVPGAYRGSRYELNVGPEGDLPMPEGFDPEKFAPALMDRSVNDMVVVARRVAAATWDGICHFAVLVTIPAGSI